MNSKNLFTGLLIILFFANSESFSQDLSFQDWDEDGDGLIEKFEFTQKFVDEYYSAWEGAQKEGIIEEGFFRETYAGLDTDNDNMLSDEEWLVGYNYFFDEYLVSKDVDLVDYNEDGTVDFDEYYDALYSTNYFTDIDLDADNYISEYELAEYVFENWDVDENGLISRSEYNRFDAYYLDV